MRNTRDWQEDGRQLQAVPGCGAGGQAAVPSFQGALDGTLALSR